MFKQMYSERGWRRTVGLHVLLVQIRAHLETDRFVYHEILTEFCGVDDRILKSIIGIKPDTSMMRCSANTHSFYNYFSLVIILKNLLVRIKSNRLIIEID